MFRFAVYKRNAAGQESFVRGFMLKRSALNFIVDNLGNYPGYELFIKE